MQVSVYKVLLISIFFGSIAAHAKCVNVTALDLVSEYPFIFKGKVQNIYISKNRDEDAEQVKLSIQVLLSYKGNLKSDLLTVSYDLKNQKPALKKYAENHVYNFFASKVDKNTAVIQNSSCLPDFTEKQIITAIEELKVSK